MIDEMYAAQQRLILNPQTPSYISEIRLIRGHSEKINDSMLIEAIDSHELSRRGATFLRFTFNARRLVNRISIDEPDTAQRHLQVRGVLRNLRNIGDYLNELRCSAAETKAAKLPETDPEDFGAARREALIEKLTLINLLLLAAATLGTFGGAKLWKNLRSRTGG
ncbi:hypothetical protein [Yoonia sediminilitoris]|nr:hypothetical protein [Yoonia sediminilitoris]